MAVQLDRGNEHKGFKLIWKTCKIGPRGGLIKVDKASRDMHDDWDIGEAKLRASQWLNKDAEEWNQASLRLGHDTKYINIMISFKRSNNCFID